MITRDRLRAGIFLPPFHPNDEDPSLCFERDFELIQFLDQLGYDEAWIGEHHSGGYETYGSPELFIATAAERTRRIRLGTGVISLPYHNPLMVADRLVQLDYQTRGRAMFGFGPGLLTSDAMMLNINPDQQRDRLARGPRRHCASPRRRGGHAPRPTGSRCAKRGCSCEPFTRPRPHMAVASAITPSGGKLAGKHGLGMLCVAASSPAGYDVLDTNWRIANEIAAQRGAQMDPS